MIDESVSDRCIADLPAAEDGDLLPEAPASEPRAPVRLLDRAPDGCCFVVADQPYRYCPEQRDVLDTVATALRRIVG